MFLVKVWFLIIVGDYVLECVSVFIFSCVVVDLIVFPSFSFVIRVGYFVGVFCLAAGVFVGAFAFLFFCQRLGLN